MGSGRSGSWIRPPRPRASSSCGCWMRSAVRSATPRRCACTRASSPTPGGSSTRRRHPRRCGSPPLARARVRSRQALAGAVRGSSRSGAAGDGDRARSARGRSRGRTSSGPTSPRRIWSEAGADPSDADDLIDVIRTVRGTDVAAFLKQQRDGRFKVSVRSRGDHDLAAVGRRVRRRRTPAGRRLHQRARPGRHDRAARAPRSRASRRWRERRRARGRRPRRQAAGHDVARCGRRGPPGARHAQGRSRRHARSDGDGPARDRCRSGHAPVAVPRRDREDLRGDVPARDRDHDARCRRRGDAHARGRRRRPRAIRAAMAAKIGTSMQSPPAFSAVKVGGRKLYDAARSGRGARRAAAADPRRRFDLVVATRRRRRLPRGRRRAAPTSGSWPPTSARRSAAAPT